MIPFIRNLNAVTDRIPRDVVVLALRIFTAMGFWQSGRTKVNGVFTLNGPT